MNHVRVLREFLYVDSGKVNSLLGQLDEGVPQESRDRESSERSSGGGAKGFAWHQADRASETEIQRSLADSNFPHLEEILEAHGILQDLSEILCSSDSWTDHTWRVANPPGSLVRVTLRGSLFDARYVAQQLAMFGYVAAGLQGLGLMPGTPRPKGQERRPQADGPHLEDAVPFFPPFEGVRHVDREYLRGLIRVSRGMFTPGLHLILTADEEADFAVTARLEEGRRYLDTSPEILFARYGIERQEWTLVGTVGHYPEAGSTGISVQNVSNGEQISRIRMAETVNAVMKTMGTIGFADLPQYPSFSVVPLAVYRTVNLSSEPGGRSLTV